jgi:hypothetical protein
MSPPATERVRMAPASVSPVALPPSMIDRPWPAPIRSMLLLMKTCGCV